MLLTPNDLPPPPLQGLHPVGPIFLAKLSSPKQTSLLEGKWVIERLKKESGFWINDFYYIF